MGVEPRLLRQPPRQPFLCATCSRRGMFICKTCAVPTERSRYQSICDRCNPMPEGNAWEVIDGKARGNDIIVEARSHRPFAVEVESFLDPDEATMYGDIEAGWERGSDASIHPDPGCSDPTEFKCSPLRGDEGLRLLYTGVQRIRDLGYRANTSCGLHAHVSLLDTAPEEREALRTFGLWIEQDIYKLVAPSRREVTYCRPLNQGNRNERYKWLNLMSWERHRTVEFRFHHGCTRPLAVVEFVKLCLRIVERGLKLGHKAQKPGGGIFDLLGLSAYEREYWTATAKKLHGENVVFEVR